MIDCYFVEVEDIQHDQHVFRYEESLSVIDAYTDPHLQPVVMMKKLDDARYFAAVFSHMTL